MASKCETTVQVTQMTIPRNGARYIGSYWRQFVRNVQVLGYDWCHCWWLFV